jgi:hypothetical protein
MSFVIARPEALARAAGHLDGAGSALAAQNAAAGLVTTGLAPAAGAQAMAVHDPFSATLFASAGSYAATEAANTIAAS